jgi:MFS family permease
MKSRLWSRNFAILWQGQLISDFGNAAFAVALGFWVLERTAGNTALMGIVEAAFAIPGVLLGPFAGTVADRMNRKWIIIVADFIRGILFTAMGAMLLFDIFPFWVIYPLAILSGSCGAFFSPAISSAIPEIVDRDNLSKANSARGLSSSLSSLLGNSLGGWLFSVLKAPLLILINGLSFLYASVTQMFMKMPFVKRDTQKQHILKEMMDGMRYTFGSKGIRTIIFTAMFINFFATTGITLLTPLFQSTPEFGVAKYGYMMGCMMLGAVAGMLIFSVVKVKPGQRALLFGASLMIMVFALVPIGILKSVAWMFPLAFIAGITNAIVNTMLQTIMQTTVPGAYRGKVFGVLGTVMQSLQPIAMAISGIVASIAGLQPTIICSFSLLVFASLPLLFSKSVKTFINTDVSQEAVSAPDVQGAALENPAPIPE